MFYLKAKSIKQKLNSAGYQINKEALGAMDAKVDDFLNRLIKIWNGHHKRITPELVSLVKLENNNAATT